MSNHIPREVLPIPRHRQASSAMYDNRDPEARYKPIAPLRPQKGA